MRSSLGLGAAVALAFAASNASAADLVALRADRFGDGETIVRYAQLHEGLPVIGRGSLERYSAVGRRLVRREDLATALPSATPTLSAADAAKIAHATRAHLLYWPTLDRGMRLAYAALPQDRRVIVDAQTGEILEVRDTRVFARARVYELNPTKTPQTSTKTLALEPTGGFLTNPFVEAHNCIDKKSVKTLDLGVSVDVHVCDLDQLAKADDSGDFLYDPIDDQSTAARSDPFSEAAIYYHAAKAYAFFRGLQGDPDAQVVTDKPLRAIANLQLPKGLFAGNLQTAADPNLPLEPFQNAFFAPAAGGLGAVFAQLYDFEAGALWFGQGPKRDYAYDGDVVYHEFTHAVVDDTLKLVAWHLDEFGAVDAPGAMNEGLADYFSCAITGDPDVGEYAAIDLGATSGFIRTLDNEDTCASVIGEVHADSTVFSGGLWEARSSLSETERTAFDKALYKAMRAAPGRGDLGYEDLTNLFLQELTASVPAGATALASAMKKRGLLVDGKGCERILDYGTDPIASPDKHLGFTAPGKQSINVKGIAPGVMQIKVGVPQAATQIHVSFIEGRAATGPSPLGGGSKPFAPTVLLKMGAPIVWSATSENGHDADVRKGADEDDVTLDLPSHDDTAYVQIASTGDTDGAYDQIAIDFKAADGSTVKPQSQATDPNHPAGAAPPTQTAILDEGCGISPRRGAFDGGAFLVALVGLSAVRRRKNRAVRRPRTFASPPEPF